MPWSLLRGWVGAREGLVAVAARTAGLAPIVAGFATDIVGGYVRVAGLTCGEHDVLVQTA